MKTGDKIVCVDDSPCKFCGAPINLIKNQVYVSMGVSSRWCDNVTRVSVLGRKSKCSHHSLEIESWVCVKRFRLLNELKNENANERPANTTRNTGERPVSQTLQAT